MDINDLYIGQSYSLSKRFSTEEVEQFAALSMDSNPIHINKNYAKKSIFKEQIVHGFLLGSLFSAIIGTALPGNGSVYLGQTLKFRKPVYHNQLVVATVTIENINIEKSLVTLRTVATNEIGVVVEGEAIVKVYGE